ncbi:MAG: phage-shock protein [Candidatus Hydrogenedentes bacterium]|nr:phage-shock protein [Candidatus Hydrogenedentota bacterium]
MFGIGIAELAVVMIFAIPIVAILSGSFIAALKVLKGSSRGSGNGNGAAEAQMIREIHHGLQKMEARVEALETILMERSGKEGK